MKNNNQEKLKRFIVKCKAHQEVTIEIMAYSTEDAITKIKDNDHGGEVLDIISSCGSHYFDSFKCFEEKDSLKYL